MKSLRVILLSFATIAIISGCGKSSSPTSAVPSLDSTPPVTPESMSITYDQVTRNKILKWAPSTSADLAGYQLYFYSPDPSRDNSFMLIAETDAGTTQYEIPAVSLPNTHFYRVRSVDTAGNRSGFSPIFEINVWPLAPAGTELPRTHRSEP